MIKSSIIALVTVAALGSIAAPAFAADSFGDSDHSSFVGGQYIDAESVLLRLHAQGVDASSVENWGGLVRAFVTQPDGTQVSQLFTRANLKPVTL